VVSSCAGAALFAVTTGAGLIAQECGLVEKRCGKMRGNGREPTLEEILAMACGAGAFFGAGYGFVRPALPRQPELAGLIYALAQGVAVRAQLNALFTRLKREQRFALSTSRLAGEVILGLWLARAERVFGPPPKD
jgi:alpha-D-ribose 1-methylphosphonate 5-triphosphate synthase subunit PhnG